MLDGRQHEVPGGSGGGAWSFAHSYDRFGNMWVSGNSGLTLHVTTPTQQSQFNAATNRLTGTGVTYDAGGNLTAYPLLGTIGYDAENRQTQFTSGSTTVAYHYDGDGRRVKQVKGSETTVFVYDAFGNLAADYSTAQATGNAGRYYRTTDHLGSTRLVTNSAGGVVSRHDFGPFGDELAASSSAGNRNLVQGFGNTSFRQKFTGKERDLDSNLDYFIARYYASPMGRFTSPDAPFADQFGGNPQTWNLYTYTRNNPLNLTDPTGRAVPLLLGCAVNAACRGAIGGVLGAAASLGVYAVTTVATGSRITAAGLESSAIQGAIVGGAVGALGPAGVEAVAVAQPGLTAASGAALNMLAGEVARVAAGQETNLANIAADNFGGAVLPISASAGTTVTRSATTQVQNIAAAANATAAQTAQIFPTVGGKMATEASRRELAGTLSAMGAGATTETAISSTTAATLSRLLRSLLGDEEDKE